MPSRYVFAADLGGTKCATAVIDRSGRIVAHRVEAVDLSSTTAPIEQICRLARELAGEHPPKEAFAAAGVAVPGLVRRDGTVWAPNLPNWERVAVRSRLRTKLKIPVVVESDRNAAVFGECWKGAARGKADVIVLIIGTGIGAGILSDARILRGAHELSGCAGWMRIAGEQSAVASQIGQLESLCSGPAIARNARRLLRTRPVGVLARMDQERLTAADVARAARRGDPVAQAVFTEMGTRLGIAVANVVSLLDPEIVVLAGGMTNALDLYLAPLKKSMFSCAQPLSVRHVKLAVSKLGQFGNLLGCAWLAWKEAGSGR